MNRSPALPGDWRPEQATPRRLAALPGRRLALLYFLLAVVPLGVSARLAHLQVALADKYRESVNRPQMRMRLVGAMRGRILARDGRVLARDRPALALAVHYRWIEDPPDAIWLRREARRRAARAGRATADQVAAAEQQIIAQRQRLLSDLARLTGEEAAVLRRRAAEIRRRVEGIWQRVHANRKQPDTSVRTRPAVQLGPEAPWMSRLWATVVDALTAPPGPAAAERLVVLEQQQY
ncbi:MAG: hypothetical protein ACOC46_01650, partial [Pirellulales bacterium]